MKSILVVEDCVEQQELIRRCLRDGYELRFAGSGLAGLDEACAAVPDLVLLDVGLPDTDGFDLCTRMKNDPALEAVPIVFLTSRAGSTEKVMAFKLGADDYVEKPFDAAELRARIETRLRGARSADARLCFPDMRLDLVRQEVALRIGDAEIVCDLTPHEFRVLHRLAARRGEPVTRAQLMESAWPGVRIAGRTVDTHVSNLRKKIAPHGDRLEAVRGVGYRLAPPRD